MTGHSRVCRDCKRPIKWNPGSRLPVDARARYLLPAPDGRDTGYTSIGQLLTGKLLSVPTTGAHVVWQVHQCKAPGGAGEDRAD